MEWFHSMLQHCGTEVNSKELQTKMIALVESQNGVIAVQVYDDSTLLVLSRRLMA